MSDEDPIEEDSVAVVGTSGEAEVFLVEDFEIAFCVDRTEGVRGGVLVDSTAFGDSSTGVYVSSEGGTNVDLDEDGVLIVLRFIEDFGDFVDKVAYGGTMAGLLANVGGLVLVPAGSFFGGGIGPFVLIKSPSSSCSSPSSLSDMNPDGMTDDG